RPLQRHRGHRSPRPPRRPARGVRHRAGPQGPTSGARPQPVTATAPARGSAYAELSRQIKSAGLLARRPGYYTLRITGNLLALARCVAAIVWLGSSWWQLLTAAVLALTSGQRAFIGHDAGHRQIGASRRTNDVIGLLHANLLSGLSFGWWIGK